MEEHQRAVLALRELSASMEENLLLFSSWLNAIMDLPEDFCDSSSEEGFYRKVREVIQANMEQRMYRFYSEDLVPGEDEIRAWLRKGSE
ncbi:Hypothetical protein BRZCDTV_449 [Brazilian cedratvirus IHUMI]|uniref:Uncharacterized protein n=1 Tax=Brazilian cedratvirus IHUMI TaxID=2126980 RepID=A0A2R8FFA7_9VIRU|nr:Hypothetical protein BRZCDTV_449 [Brazilian cedratvirus IHUMI]